MAKLNRPTEFLNPSTAFELRASHKQYASSCFSKAQLDGNRVQRSIMPK